MPKKKTRPTSKWNVKDLELECVGIQYRASISTRRFIRSRVEAKPMEVYFKRDADNVHDHNAIAVYAGGSKEDNPYYKMQLGYIRRHVAEVFAPLMDEGLIEFGTSLMTELDELEGIAQLQVKLRVRRNAKISLDKVLKVG